MVHLEHRDGRPIYVQIKESLIAQVAAGVLLPGDKLPSVRELAGSLVINPNTIQRAYRELEQQGVIETIPGKGCFVCEKKGNETAALWKQLEGTVQALKALGVSEEELTARLKGDQNG